MTNVSGTSYSFGQLSAIEIRKASWNATSVPGGMVPR